MKYHVIEEEDFLLIKLSGKAKKNEAVLAKRKLANIVKGKNVKVIMDFKELDTAEPLVLLGVINSLKKEIGQLRGGLKLCSLKTDILRYFKENHMDQIFMICENKDMAKNSDWRLYHGGR